MQRSGSAETSGPAPSPVLVLAMRPQEGRGGRRLGGESCSAASSLTLLPSFFGVGEVARLCLILSYSVHFPLRAAGEAPGLVRSLCRSFHGKSKAGKGSSLGLASSVGSGLEGWSPAVWTWCWVIQGSLGYEVRQIRGVGRSVGLDGQVSRLSLGISSPGRGGLSPARGDPPLPKMLKQ